MVNLAPRISLEVTLYQQFLDRLYYPHKAKIIDGHLKRRGLAPSFFIEINRNSEAAVKCGQDIVMVELPDLRMVEDEKYFHLVMDRFRSRFYLPDLTFEESEELRGVLMEAIQKDQFKLTIDLNVLNHLGIGLYSNTPAVLTEIVANAWDADAHLVDVDISQDEVVITDDGHGMSRDDLEYKFLTVGYDRRNHGEEKTPEGRQCMGRKGIGKLAMFSLAHEVHVISKTELGSIEGFIVDVEELKEKISNKQDYYTQTIKDFSSYGVGGLVRGTVIVLRNLQNNVNKTPSFFKRRIARRFSVIGDFYDFNVRVNGEEVTLADRGFYNSIQFLWTFGENDHGAAGLSSNKKRHKHFDGITPSGQVINGFISSVSKPEQLRYEDDNNNAITLLANGRVFEEDIQKRLDDSKVFNSYLVGELHYNILDANDQPDIAVSSRQGVQENDQRFREFLGYMQSRFAEIALDWDVWRRELGAEEMMDEFPKVKEWVDGLRPRYRSKAKQFINKVNTMRFGGTAEEQTNQKKDVLRSLILAFEKLLLNDNLNELDSLDIQLNVSGFANALLTVKDIEAALYYDITSQRLRVIEKLDQAQDDGVKERVVQDQIYKNLWLIDSRWEYKEFPQEYEKTITEYLKKAYPDAEGGARYDIGYRTTSGRFVVIELKKPGLSVNGDKLIAQGEKYALALEQYYLDYPDPSLGQINSSNIDIVFIVDKKPALNRFLEKRLGEMNGRIITYKGVVRQAKTAYREYLDASSKTNRIEALFGDF